MLSGFDRYAAVTICLVFLSVLFCGSECTAQLEDEARVVDGSGGWMSNSLYRCLSAACQPAPIGTGAGGGLHNQSGFLFSFLYHPDLDNDADGMADEDDPDDDNDGLSDAGELSGVGFDPQTPTDSLLADSDGDGADDASEAQAGTNPRDAGSHLRITDLQVAGGEAVVTWSSREGYSYDLIEASTAAALNRNGTTVSTVTATDGVGAWQETASSVTNPAALPAQFYRVRVAPY